MRRRPPFLALVFALALAAPLLAQEWKGRARIDGRVSDEDGSPLGGATVFAHPLQCEGGPRVTIGSDGRFTLDGVAAGSWVLEVTAAGHRTRSIGVHLPDESSWLGPVSVVLPKVDQEPDPPPVEPASPTPPDGPAPEGEPGASVGYRAVQLALGTGRSDLARTLAASVSPGDTGSPELLVEIGRGFLIAGETSQAVAFFGRAIEQEPTHVEARFERALGLLALGNLGDAREDLESVLELRPDSPLAARASQALEELASLSEESR